MLHSTLASQGNQALEQRNWAEAVDKLTAALQAVQSPLYLVARSKAFAGAGQPDRALADAEQAWNTGYERGQRPVLIEAQYRRAVAYFHLGQLANADCCAVWSLRLCEGFPAREPDPQLACRDSLGRYAATVADVAARIATMNPSAAARSLLAGKLKGAASPAWNLAASFRIQVLTALGTLDLDDPAHLVTATLIPPIHEHIYLGEVDHKPAEPPVPTHANAETGRQDAVAVPGPTVGRTASPTHSPADIRVQDFQSDRTISVSIFVKGVNKDKLKVEFTSSQVTLHSVPLPNGTECEFSISLWSQITPSQCTYLVTPNKIEVKLQKQHPGKWKQLRADPVNASSDPTVVVAPTATATEPAPSVPSPSVPVSSDPAPTPAYPTSAKSGPKNWDAVVSATDGDGDEADKDVNHFFQQLYTGATPEQQRAMMKSFVESSGTALSTDWSDVKSRTVPVHPPDGVEAKKWT